MTLIIKRSLIVVFIFGLITMFNRCIYIGALIMSKEEKTTIDEWKSGNYKTRIQRRRGWAGPHYYHCRIKEKKIGGLYYQKIVTKSFSRESYAGCVLKFPFQKDTIRVDVCKKNTHLNR